MSQALLISDLRTAIASAWPEIDTDGIYRVRQLARKGFDKARTPYAILQVPGKGSPSDQGPINAGVCVELEITIYYVLDDQAGVDNAALVEVKLDALRAYLRANDCTNAQILEFCIPDASETNAANMTLLDRQVARTAGSLSIRVLYGEM